jgi:hypothetical protein
MPQKRSLRCVLAVNVISMLGSGMNSGAVAWAILQLRNEFGQVCRSANPTVIRKWFSRGISSRHIRRAGLGYAQASTGVSTLEGVARFMSDYLRLSFSSSAK